MRRFKFSALSLNYHKSWDLKRYFALLLSLFGGFSLAYGAERNVASRASGLVTHYPNEGFAPPVGETVENTLVAGAQSSSAPLLLKPENLSAPSLANDINSALMSEELMSQLEAQYAQRLRDFAMQKGFFITASDSRSSKPLGWNQEKEVALRAEMARSIKQYMLVRGIPKFLSTRRDTKQWGAAYARTLNTVATAATLEVVTQDKWRFSSGFNPITMNAWANYSNVSWKFELADNFRNRDPHLFGSRLLGRYSFDSNFHLLSKVWDNGMSWQVNPVLSTRLAYSVPVRSDDVLGNSVTTVSMAYAF